MSRSLAPARSASRPWPQANPIRHFPNASNPKRLKSCQKTFPGRTALRRSPNITAAQQRPPCHVCVFGILPVQNLCFICAHLWLTSSGHLNSRPSALIRGQTNFFNRASSPSILTSSLIFCACDLCASNTASSVCTRIESRKPTTAIGVRFFVRAS